MKTRGFVIGYFFFILLVFAHQEHFDGPTPLSRLCLLKSICTKGRLEINGCQGRTPDCGGRSLQGHSRG
jgi:hypothetical protein